MRRIGFLPLILIFIILLLIDYYVYLGLTPLFTGDKNTAPALVYWLFSGGILLSFFYGLYTSLVVKRLSRFFNVVFNIFITVFVTKIVFILVLVLQDGYRLIALLAGSELPLRNALVTGIGLLVSAVPFFSFIYGVTYGKYNYTVHRHTIYFDDLPEAFDGFTVTQISDIHSGSFDNRAAVKKGVELINRQKSDLFVFTGDLVNNKAEEVLPWIDVFSAIEAPYGKYSVLGNHDYGDYITWKSNQEKAENLDHLKAYHAEMGFRLLLDESKTLTKNNEQIALLGIENWGIGFGERGDLKKALSSVNPAMFKILLSHDPSHWSAQVKDYPVKINLTLSGHTHGMQFGIELFGWKWSPVKYRYPHWAGLTEENGRSSYVNRGFGFLGFSGRVGIWPEITVLTLKKKR